MPIKFTECRGITNHPLIIELINNIDKDKYTFLLVSRIFNMHKKNDDISFIIEQVETIFDNPSIKVKLRNKIKTLIVQIYKNTRFCLLRSGVLEAIIQRYGPFHSKHCKCFIEPKIIDTRDGREIIVGGSDNRCDFVYYVNETIPMDFIECKTDIENFFPKTLSIEKMHKDDSEQFKYLIRIYNYLDKHYCEPKISFACFNENCDLVRTNVQKNWGYKYINFIGSKEIYSMIS